MSNSLNSEDTLLSFHWTCRVNETGHCLK